ncbi:hypothetical protein SCLCIDRAFT_1109090 [Scleroderma citrinum Foug A]|uniref:Uncharacterized protein n=1 Tax=Scleroderma citrinum Foug A TaxID=1036808 RepID=A0A0C3EI19_9AGAM|nr:hypothetical protein SCLCIDRAFT_1109090 [Scleroderma citrinum Foug A]
MTNELKPGFPASYVMFKYRLQHGFTSTGFPLASRPSPEVERENCCIEPLPRVQKFTAQWTIGQLYELSVQEILWER